MSTRPTTPAGVREAIGSALHGDVLEIGPGHQPFPTPTGTRVTFADRPLEGGRDANFPELVGHPHGPDADVELDLDVDGLRAFADGSFDAVIASHMIEHVANPIGALCEMHRVLRPGGRLVLLVPDRAHTFDAGRAPTPLGHLVDEHRRGVTVVDDDHIREFCAAIHAGPVIHPPEVRDWHDPDRLDAERMALHRRRSIHVHCWNPEEFAALVVGLAALDIAGWELVDLYVRDDLDDDGDEFGLVLARPRAASPAARRSAALVEAWASAVLGDDRRDPARVLTFVEALRRDLDADAADRLVPVALARLTDEVGRLRKAVHAGEQQLAEARARAQQADDQLAAIMASRGYRVGRTLAASARAARRLAGERDGPSGQS